MSEKKKSGSLTSLMRAIDAQVLFVRTLDMQYSNLHELERKLKKITKAVRHSLHGQDAPDLVTKIELEFCFVNTQSEELIRRIAYTIKYMAPHMADELAEIFLRTKAAHEGAQ